MAGRPSNVMKRANEEIMQAIATLTPEEFQGAFDQLKVTEQRFVLAYVECGNPRTAMIAAMPELGERATLADVRAWDYIRRPLVRAAIAEKQRAVMERFEISIDRVTQEIAKIAFSNIEDYTRLTSQGERFVDLSNATRDQLAAVAEIQTEDFTEGRGEDAREIRKVRFKLHNKLDGLDKLMRKLGGYAPERFEHSGPGGAPMQMLQVTVDMTPEDAAEAYARSLRSEDDDE